MKIRSLLSLLARKTVFSLTAGDTLVTASFTNNDLNSLLKYMAYGAYLMHHEQPNAQMLAKFKHWGEEAKPVLKSLKISTRIIDAISRSIPTGKWTEAKRDKVHDTTWELRNEIHTKKGVIRGTRGVPAKWVTLLNYLDTYYNSSPYNSTKGANSYKNIEKMVGELSEPSLTGLMNHTVDETADPSHIHAHQDFIKKHMKDKSAKFITPEARAAMKPATLEKLKELTKNSSAAMSALRRKIVRESGEPLMPIAEYRKAFKKHGIDLWQIPEGFDGLVDENGKYFTKTGHALNGLPVGGKVSMNPKWHPVKQPGTWVAKGKGLKQENEATYYTLDHVNKGREAKKAESLEAMAEWLPKMQKQWNKDLKTKGLDQTLAMMVECLYLTSARPGTNENAKSSGGDTYGLSTWLVKHIRPQANGSLKITYRPGKSKTSKLNTTSATNVNISHTIKPDTPQSKALIAFLKKSIEGKKPSEPVWTYGGKRVNSNMLNGYIKELSDGHISPKNFRTFRGTKLFLEMLESKPPKKNITERELKAYHDKISGEVGKLLGHVKTNAKGERENTPRTAQNSYISPQAQIDLFRDRGYQPPSHILKFES